MKSFNFENNTSDNEELEYALRYRKRKLFKQQAVFVFILMVIVAILAVFIYRNTVYTRLDGYVTSEVEKERVFDDMLVCNMFVRVGSAVFPGDTLYSYLHMNTVFEQFDVNAEPTNVVNRREMDMKATALIADIRVLRVKISDLAKQIAMEDHNIRYGLSSSSHKMDLQRQLNENKEELSAKLATLAQVNANRKTLSKRIKESSYYTNMRKSFNSVINNISQGPNSQLRYKIANDSGVVVNIYCAENTFMFRTEEVLDIMPINSKKSNTSLWCYVPVEKIHQVKKGKRVTIDMGSDVTLQGEFGLVGVRTEELPKDLRSNFARQGRVMIAQVLVDTGQVVPFWCVTDGAPIRVSFPNFRPSFNPKSGPDMFYVTGGGMTKESQMVFDKQRHNRKNLKRMHYEH
jgi:hypothetical protein